MAEAHDAHHDPNAAPMHHDIVEDFAPVHLTIAVLLGLAASVAGLICGLLLIND